MAQKLIWSFVFGLGGLLVGPFIPIIRTTTQNESTIIILNILLMAGTGFLFSKSLVIFKIRLSPADSQIKLGRVAGIAIGGLALAAGRLVYGFLAGEDLGFIVSATLLFFILGAFLGGLSVWAWEKCITRTI